MHLKFSGLDKIKKINFGVRKAHRKKEREKQRGRSRSQLHFHEPITDPLLLQRQQLPTSSSTTACSERKNKNLHLFCIDLVLFCKDLIWVWDVSM